LVSGGTGPDARPACEIQDLGQTEEHLGDGDWFERRRHRLFRARAARAGIWLIRRRRQADGPDVFLRVVAADPVAVSASDLELAVAWYCAAYPDWPPERCRKWARRALRRSRGAR
jgi:hypothetical protein